MLDGVTIINETRDYISIVFCTIALIMVFIVNIIFIKDVLIIHNYGDRVLDKIHSISVEAVLVLCILVAGIGMIDGIVTPIYEVKISDAKLWLIKLQENDGLSYSTIHSIRGVLRPAFKMALDDELIRKNPFDFSAFTIIVNDGVRRDALTHDQKRKFLAFIKNDKHFCKYYDAIYILFYTGMRISEFTGLTINDIDLKAKKINIERQLIRPSNMRYTI